MRLKNMAYISALLGSVALPSAALAVPTCADLGTNPVWGLAGNPQLSSLSVAIQPAAGPDAAYCKIQFIYTGQVGIPFGYYPPGPGEKERIGLLIGLPLNSADGGTGGVQGAWNGKQRDLGGGGYQGLLTPVTESTNLGYAGSNTDTGHQSLFPGFGAIIDGTFALTPAGTLNQGLITDFASDGVHQQHDWTRRITKLYYGTYPTRTYWVGCSTGGRQGFQQIQKSALDYDGVLAGAPAINWDRFIPAEIWPQIVMNQELGAPILPTKLNAVSAAATAACDALDGVSDGLLQDPRKCTYSATSFICVVNGGPSLDPNCLTPAEAAAVNKIWDGPRNVHGRKIWFGLEKGADLTALAGTPPFPIATMHYSYWVKQNPLFDWHTVTETSFVDDFVLSELKFAEAISTDQPILTKFRDNGGKVITYHGLDDQLIPPRGTYDYTRRVAAGMGGLTTIQSFYRFFPYPGQAHCAGGTGPAISVPDLFNALVAWVEGGTPPNYIVATQASPARTRKICKYPDTLVYNGSGSTDDQANFTCQTNANDDPALVTQDILAKRYFENQ